MGWGKGVKVLEQDDLSVVWARDLHLVPSIWKCVLTSLCYSYLGGFVEDQRMGPRGQRDGWNLLSLLEMLTITSET